MSVLRRSCPAFFTVALAALAALSPAAAADARPAAKAPDDLASAIAKRCRSAEPGKERSCYTAAIEEQLAVGGPAPVLQLLDRLAALDPKVRRDGHFYAHHIGISALKSPAEVGRVFASCTPAYQSGCYHGVMQAYFRSTERSGGGVTTQTVEALCRDYRGKRADLLFQCTHGLGHGLAILHRHDLPQALQSCDLLSRNPEREMCYAGAFMESLVNATQAHALPAADKARSGSKAKGKAKAKAVAHAEHGPHHQHGPANAGPAPAQPPFRALDPADLHYPCSRMDEKYLIACYTIQTSAMLHHSGRDVGRAASECGRAPEKARITCFVSLGRDVSTFALNDIPEAVRLCGLAEKGFRPDCHRGVVLSVVNMNANPADGIPYCRAVTERESKLDCYVAVGLHAAGLPEGQARREQACRLAEAEMVDICLGRPVSPRAGGSLQGRSRS